MTCVRVSVRVSVRGCVSVGGEQNRMKRRRRGSEKAQEQRGWDRGMQEKKRTQQETRGHDDDDEPARTFRRSQFKISLSMPPVNTVVASGPKLTDVMG
jgi:hypothetical protein